MGVLTMDEDTDSETVWITSLPESRSMKGYYHSDKDCYQLQPADKIRPVYPSELPKYELCTVCSDEEIAYEGGDLSYYKAALETDLEDDTPERDAPEYPTPHSTS